MRHQFLVSLLLGTLVVPLGARQALTSAGPRQLFGTATSAIVVDVVVRDKRGNPVTDLQKQDFQLFEDGVQQEIGDVTVVAPDSTTLRQAQGVPNSSGAEHAASAATTPSADETKAGRPSPNTFVALVFDRLSPEARALAYKGALAYLETFRDNDFAGVFLSDLSLSTIETYTNDRAKIRHAIDEVASRATSSFGQRAESNSSSGDDHASVPVVASAESSGRRVVDGSMVMEGLSGGRQSWDGLERAQQGYATTNALMALATTLGALPGRKAIVFFAEGVAIPDAVLPQFRNVVATANRGNVSIYTVDAVGLRVHSKDAETGRAVRGIGKAGITLRPDGSNSSSLDLLEINEDVLRKDPRTSLTLLAQETGGFLVDNTNDLANAFRRIDGDRRFHYLLTYTPKRSDFNGEWRKLTVKVSSRPVTVRARSGYLAVHAPGAIPLLVHEGPALAALNRMPRPTDIAVRAAALVFPGVKENRVAVLVATTGTALTFAPDVRAVTYRTDFTILARVRDASGEVIRKASQPYRLSGPLAQLEQARGGDVLFFREPILGPGIYALDVVVHDALAKRAGVQTSTFTVPDAGGGLVSSLIVVQRGERVAVAEPPNGNPLRIADVLLYPNLGEPIRKTARSVTVFVTIVPAHGITPQATLNVMHGDQALAGLPLTLDTPDKTGRIQQLAQIPIASLAPGNYTLRLIVRQGSSTATRDADIVVVP